MDIPNLSQNPQIIPTLTLDPVSPPKKSKNNKILFFIIIVLAITSGFWLSRFWPLNDSGDNNISTPDAQKNIASTENISNAADLIVGQSYGDTGKSFTDTASGTLVKGGINGEGTHTLQREGGKTQNAALTSSTVDLDLFIDKKVEIKGETNSSTKAGWFLDVGVIKILE